MILAYKVFMMALSLTVLLASCEGCDKGKGFFATNGEEGRQARHTLRLADSLMEENPDTAYALLRQDSAMIQKTGQAERMRFALLKTQAEDKLYIPHKSDSVMREVVAYYEEHGSASQKAQAYYVLGRVYHDLFFYGSALSTFEKAMELESTSDSVTNYYKAQSATWAGAIYEEKSLDSTALRFREKAYNHALLTGDTVLTIYTSRDLGRSLAKLEKNQQAITFYRNAIRLARAIHNAYLYNMISEELAYIYIKTGKLREAHEALSTPTMAGSRKDYVSRYGIWASYYERLNMPDSAIAYFEKALAYATINERWEIFRNMAVDYKVKGAQENALRYALLAMRLSDSLQNKQALETKNFCEKVEENIKNQRHNEKLTHERDRLVILLLSIAICAIIALFAIWQYYNKRRKEQQEREWRLKRMLEEKEQESLSFVQEGERTIHQLEGELYSATEQLALVQKKLSETQTELQRNHDERKVIKKKQADLLETELRHSDIYIKFHNPNSSITIEDFNHLEEALNKAYDGFVIRLRKLYPAIRTDELQECCLLKIGLQSKERANIMSYRPNTLSMMRKRLFTKITGKDGGANDLDELIRRL